jgi:DNA polymerase I-like protein with 3'-5' exonuclease and polymerase domains
LELIACDAPVKTVTPIAERIKKPAEQSPSDVVGASPEVRPTNGDRSFGHRKKHRLSRGKVITADKVSTVEPNIPNISTEKSNSTPTNVRINKPTESSPNDVVGASPEVQSTNGSFGHRKRRKQKSPTPSSPNDFVGASPDLQSSTNGEKTFSRKTKKRKLEKSGHSKIDRSITDSSKSFNKFIDKLVSTKVFSMSLACVDAPQESRQVSASRRIGERFITSGVPSTNSCSTDLIATVTGDKLKQLTGVAFSLDGKSATFVSFTKDTPPLSLLKDGLLRLSNSNRKTIVMHDSRVQLRILWQTITERKNFPGYTETIDVFDPKLGAWFLDTSRGEMTFTELVKMFIGTSIELTGNVETNACNEAILSYNLYQTISSQLENRDFSLESKCSILVAEMETVGIGFDGKRCSVLRTELETVRQSIQKDAYKSAGKVFNLSSRGKVVQILNELIPDEKIDSLDKETLKALNPRHPLPELILKWRKIGMALTQFVIPFCGAEIGVRNKCTGLAVHKGSRISAEWEYFTCIGRLSTSEPNLQSIFKDFKALNTVFSLRKMFVAKSTSNAILIAADYCQVDLRLLAHLSVDRSLLNDLNSGKDVLCIVAAAYRKKSIEDVTKEERQAAKQVVYGMIYGIGEASLAKQMGATQEQAGCCVSTFKRIYPVVQKYIRMQAEKARKEGYVCTISGRRRYLLGINSENSAERSESFIEFILSIFYIYEPLEKI